jgi:uncharacterized protein (DUF1778 family)
MKQDAKRRKPQFARQEELIKARVTAAEKLQLQQAAKRAGMDLSSWLRMIALKAARDSDTLSKSQRDRWL